MNIKMKLIVVNLSTLIGLGLALLVTITGLNATQEAENTFKRRILYITNLLEIKASALSSIMLDPTLQETRDVFATAEKNIKQHGAIVLEVIKRPEIKEEFRKILAQWDNYDQESQKIIKLAVTDVTAANNKLVPLYNQSFMPLQAALEKFVSERRIEATEAEEQARSISRKTFWGITVLLTLVTIVVLAMVFSLSWSLQASIKGIQEKLLPLRQGDLTQRLPDTRKDEFGEISAGINSFVEELQAIMLRTRDRSNHLSKAAMQLKSASVNVLQSANQQNDAASSVAASVEQFSISIDQVSDNATQAEQKATLSGDISRRGGTEVHTAVDEIRHIEKVVSEAAQQMDALGQQAREISGIVNVIREVADQTNLLALNAAIEAARAGESGRGFAVVADEVRKLAERTSASAQEITLMVTAIQEKTNKATSAMQNGHQLVADGVRHVEQAGDSMQQINESSVTVVGAVADISSALREQRIAGAEIAKNVEHIAQLTEHGRNSAAEVSSAAVSLETLASQLHNEVEKFKV